MENKTGKIYNLKITTFSPVHIWDNDVFEPTCYVIAASDAQGETIYPGYKNKPDAKYCLSCDGELQHNAETSSNNDSCLYTFTPKQLAEALSYADKKNLLSIAQEGNYISLQKFFKDNTFKIVQTGVKHSKVCAEIAKQYADKCGNFDVPPKERNKFKIEKNISNPATDIAYIPGSSLKGAIRTALMSEHNESMHLDAEKYKKTTYKGYKYNASDAEKVLFGYTKTTNNPFKYLKLSDTVPDNDFLTEICVARNYKRNSGGSQMFAYVEVIPHNTIFSTELLLAKNSSAKSGTYKEFPEDMASIRTACNDFYGDIMALEQSYITNQPQLYTKLKQARQKPNAFLLRLGKYCSAENVTIDGMRRIWNKVYKTYMSHSTTYWLADNGREKLPFGWCVVEFEEVK